MRVVVLLNCLLLGKDRLVALGVVKFAMPLHIVLCGLFGENRHSTFSHIP